MKRLLFVISVTLALNFLLAVGGIAYLVKTGRLDEDKIRTIRELVMNPATQPVATQPTERDPTTQPSVGLEALLAKVAGRTAGEQVEFMQRTFDSQNAILERQRQNLQGQKKFILDAQKQLEADRLALAADRAQLAAEKQQQTKLATDQGFQDTLNLYNTMQPKQVKTIFMSLDEDTVINYLRAMEPRAASKITKEFKTPEETAKVSRILEKMRQAVPATQPTPGSPTASANP